MSSEVCNRWPKRLLFFGLLVSASKVERRSDPGHSRERQGAPAKPCGSVRDTFLTGQDLKVSGSTASS